MTYKSVSPDINRVNPVDTPGRNREINYMKPDEMAAFLQAANFEECTTEALVKHGINGEQLQTLCLDEKVDEILETELHIKSPLMRIKFKSLMGGGGAHRNYVKSPDDKPPYMAGQFTREALKRLRFSGLPKVSATKSIFNAAQWRNYGIGTVGEIKTVSQFLAECALSIFEFPNQKLDGLTDKFSEIDFLADQIWFNHTVTKSESSAVLQQQLVLPVNYQLDGRDRGRFMAKTATAKRLDPSPRVYGGFLLGVVDDTSHLCLGSCLC